MVEQKEKYNEDTCFEVLYYCKLFQLLNENNDTKSVIDFVCDQFLPEKMDISDKFLVHDSFRSAYSIYNKIKDMMMVTEEGADQHSRIIESAQKALVKFVEEIYTPKSLPTQAHESKNALPQKIVPKKEPIRIYIDGCFDLLHSGHYNAIRQANLLGDVLVVGVNSDAEILKNKGPTVLNCEERAEILRACKWVDELYLDTEYSVDIEVLDRYNCQYYAHGDDPVINYKGEDVTAILASQGRFKMFKRTEGVSTTDIVGKLLLLTKESNFKQGTTTDKPLTSSNYIKEMRRLDGEENKQEGPSLEREGCRSMYEKLESMNLTQHSSFLATTRRILHFSNQREPKPTDEIIYISGSFDLLHNAHIEMLKTAKSKGSFLYVGLWPDEVVREYRGHNFPIITLHERVLMILANRYVDDVVIGAPYEITKDFLKSLNISKVVKAISKEDEVLDEKKNIDAYQVAKEMGIYEEFVVQNQMTIETIAERVFHNRSAYMQKYSKKKESLDKYYTEQKQNQTLFEI